MKLSPAFQVKLAANKQCPFCIRLGYSGEYACTIVGNKLEGTNSQFYYQYHGTKPCSILEANTCTLRVRI